MSEEVSHALDELERDKSFSDDVEFRHAIVMVGVTNRAVINWCAKLAAHGLLEPRLVKQRIRSYRVIADGLRPD